MITMPNERKDAMQLWADQVERRRARFTVYDPAR
jgi:hypothetical protein